MKRRRRRRHCRRRRRRRSRRHGTVGTSSAAAQKWTSFRSCRCRMLQISPLQTRWFYVNPNDEGRISVMLMLVSRYRRPVLTQGYTNR